MKRDAGNGMLVPIATSISLEEAGGVRVGQKVRVNDGWIARLNAAGAGAYEEAFRIGGEVVRIVAHKDGLWTLVVVRLDKPPKWMVSTDESAFAPSHLEPT